MMILKTLSFIFVALSWPLATWAVTADVSSETVSGVDATDKSNIILFAGFAGDIGSCSTSAVSTTSVCNSCDALNLCSASATKYYQCAQRSIHRELLLTLQLTLDSVPASPTVKVFWKDSSQEITPKSAPASGSIQANQPFTVQIRWGDICSKAGFNDSCTYTTSSSVDASNGVAETLAVGVTDGGTTFNTGAYQKFTVRLTYAKPDDSGSLIAAPIQPSASGDPFTDFKVIPGDSKVYVTDIWRGSVGPSESGVKWNALRVYYAAFAASTPPAPDFCSIAYSGGDYADLAVEDKTNVETSLADNKVKGLINEQLYMFNIATVDEASVVSGFISPTALTALSDAAKARYWAQPGEVVGLLDDKKCFIATAAFGSPMEPHVALLRKFRNQFLLSSNWGKKFVQFYYQNSPPLAHFIARHEILRTTVRGVLWPVVLFADLSLKFGFFLTFGLFALTIVSLILLGRLTRRSF